MRTLSIAGVMVALAVSSAGSALAQVAGQPTLLPPRPVPATPHRPPAARPHPARPAQPARNTSTPESRSAAELAMSSDPTFDEGTFERIKEALLSYSAIQVRGGWPMLPADSQARPGASGPNVALLRRRLAVTEDLAADKEAGDDYDAAVVEAVKHFQLRHGLDVTGAVNPLTLRALNVPVGQRIKQLEASLDRLLGMDFTFGERYVVVNIPAAFAEAVANGKVERRYRVIVGKTDKPSPTLSVYITAIDLNPTWTVPLSITKNEIFTRMRKDPNYLSRMHMRVFGAHDQEIDPHSIDWASDRSPNFFVRQDSGPWNALGNLKIDMPNPYSVYMHDTDTRQLFSKDYRFDSHGCTRVDNVRDLAAWILQDVPGWDRAAIDAGIATGEKKIINLPHRIPVAWVYLTGWMTRDGTVEFRNDVYEHDEALDRTALDRRGGAGRRLCGGRAARAADHQAGFQSRQPLTRACFMRRAILLAGILSGAAAPLPALANDTTAELANGGLIFVTNDNVEMRSENLFISTGQIRVTYDFFNKSNKDVTVLVAFPLPEIRISGEDDNIAVPTQDPVNFVGFKTTVNGKPVTTQVEQRVTAVGIDRTQYLRALGIPLAPQLAATDKALDALPKDKWAEVVGLGLGAITEYDAGSGMQQHLEARWGPATTFYWQQTFAAGQETIVQHQYTPSVGSSAQTNLGSPDETTQSWYGDYLQKYCIDKSFLATIQSLRKANKSEFGPPYTEQRIDYILTTGANWSGPIQTFKLVIDKGSADNLMSFCGTGVSKTSPTQFQMQQSNFTPDSDLSILILSKIGN